MVVVVVVLERGRSCHGNGGNGDLLSRVSRVLEDF